MTQDPQILQSLRRMNLAGNAENPPILALTGGVSGDVFRVDLASGPICIKRALPRLKVAAEWLAPVERIHSEADWFRFAGGVEPGCVPGFWGKTGKAIFSQCSISSLPTIRSGRGNC